MMKSLRKKFKGRYLRKGLIYFLSWCLVVNTFLPAAMAEVVLDSEINGSISVTPLDGGITQSMTASNGAIGYFSDFDIAAGHIVNLSQTGGPNPNALFKVFSEDGTQILGQFNANGNVFLVDSAGILFGADSVINVNQLVASSLDISNEDFLADNYEFLAGDGDIGDVINEGTIGNEGFTEGVALIGRKVLNTGTIMTTEGGFVVLAAGDRVLLGEPGSKILVEMDSVTLSGSDNPEGYGSVTNEGQITAPGGTVVLAAGDIFSVPLHPQLQVNTGTEEEPVYDPAYQPVRVESGIGTVTQSGTISADGGSITLTAGNANAENDDKNTLDDDIPDVVLSAGSVTQAVGGEVTAYAYDFGTKGATGGAITSFEDGAVINVGTGTAKINGNHILFGGSINAEPGGKILVDPVNLRIADTMPVTGPELDTLYEEEHVEFYSQAGVDLDLAADDMITVEYMADSDVVGEITGGSGEIYLRNVFDEGGIYFEQMDEDGHTGPRSSICTVAYYESPEVYRDGGNIYMDAGSNGIVAGDLFTGVKSNDKWSQPGEIVLRTTNGGDIEVGTMQAIGANSTQVSAISDGDLTVNGNVESINKQTDNAETSVFWAIGCLVAEGDIYLNGDNYRVEAHGKGEVRADIRISAGGSVHIGSEQSPATISAEAKLSGTATHSTAYVVIHAGRNGEGEIVINGETYTPGSVYLTSGDIVAKAWPGSGSPLSVDTTGTPTTDDTESVWEETVDPPDWEDYFVRIEINSDAPGLGPCEDCPQPPGLPPVPHIFIIANDTFPVGWSAENAPLDVLANDYTDELGNPVRLILGDIADPQPITTDLGGTLTVTVLTDEFGDPILDDLGNPIVGFEYTPPSGVEFVWDGGEYAYFTDTFSYKAEDSLGNESVNSASVTITVTNFLPVLSGDSDTIHMGSTTNPTSASFDLDGLIVDPDGSPQPLITEYDDSTTVGGTVSLIDSTATYDPYNGFATEAGTPDTFQYTVVDNQIVDEYGDPVVLSETIEVTVDNTLPSGDGWIGMVENNSTDNTQNDLADGFNFIDPDMAGDVFLDTHQLIPGTYTGNHGGTLTISYNEGTDEWTYVYTPSAGYEGDNVDDWFDTIYNKGTNPDEVFHIQVWDGQLDYSVEGSPTPVYGEGMIYVDIENTPAFPPAPLPEPLIVEVSGCPALIQWVAAELGSDQKEVQIWVAKALASPGSVQPCDACESLKEAATILQDVDGTRVAALAEVINEFASSDAPPTEEQMASIADAIANDIEGNIQYAAAGEYLDALAKYVGILSSEMDFTTDEAVQFATNNYVDDLVEAEKVGVAAYVAARLTALGGSE